MLKIRYFNLADFPVNFINQFVLLSKFLSYYCIRITKNIAYHIAELLIFYSDKLMVTGNSKNLCVFNFAILLKSQRFDAHEMYMFYINYNSDSSHPVA